jgi:phosphoribosyl 1,2-cyclic phosphodiesterase
LGSFEITPFGVPHDSTDNVGYSIVVGGVTFCLMTDVGHITDEMKGYIGSANYLVIESNHDEDMVRQGPYPMYLKTRILGDTGHLSNNNCGLALAENATEKLKQVWLCHLSEENNHPELARKTVESVLRSYGIIVGKDFKLEVLKRRTPSEIYELK